MFPCLFHWLDKLLIHMQIEPVQMFRSKHRVTWLAKDYIWTRLCFNYTRGYIPYICTSFPSSVTSTLFSSQLQQGLVTGRDRDQADTTRFIINTVVSNATNLNAASSRRKRCVPEGYINMRDAWCVCCMYSCSCVLIEVSGSVTF